MTKRCSTLLLLLLASITLAACKRQPALKVLNVSRADHIAEDIADRTEVRRPDSGMLFLRVALDAGTDLGDREALIRFLNLVKLTDERGNSLPPGGPGFLIGGGRAPNQIDLIWSVPNNQTNFVLDHGGTEYKIEAAQPVKVYLPDIDRIPTIPEGPEIEVPPAQPVPGGVVIGSTDGVEAGPIGPDSGPPVVAPDEPPPPKPTPAKPRAPISGGVLNGRALSLPKPPYPAIAKAARAAGTVTVQVTIDETGKVISARAVGGHPLLQQAAVQAAYAARFPPTKLSGQPVKVTGVITYNFVAQ